MPYESKAQEKFFNVNRKKLEAQGVNVDQWNKESAGRKLPKRINKNNDPISMLERGMRGAKK